MSHIFLNRNFFFRQQARHESYRSPEVGDLLGSPSGRSGSHFRSALRQNWCSGLRTCITSVTCYDVASLGNIPAPLQARNTSIGRPQTRKGRADLHSHTQCSRFILGRRNKAFVSRGWGRQHRQNTCAFKYAKAEGTAHRSCFASTSGAAISACEANKKQVRYCVHLMKRTEKPRHVLRPAQQPHHRAQSPSWRRHFQLFFNRPKKMDFAQTL